MSEVTLERHLLKYAVRGIHEDMKDRLAHISKYEMKSDLLTLCQDYQALYMAQLRTVTPNKESA